MCVCAVCVCVRARARVRVCDYRRCWYQFGKHDLRAINRWGHPYLRCIDTDIGVKYPISFSNVCYPVPELWTLTLNGSRDATDITTFAFSCQFLCDGLISSYFESFVFSVWLDHLWSESLRCLIWPIIFERIGVSFRRLFFWCESVSNCLN